MARQHGSQTSIALLSKWEIWPFKPPLRRGFVYATDYILRNIKKKGYCVIILTPLDTAVLFLKVHLLIQH